MYTVFSVHAVRPAFAGHTRLAFIAHKAHEELLPARLNLRPASNPQKIICGKHCGFAVGHNPPRLHSDQGLKFRRNFAEIRWKISFSLVTGKKNFGIFRKISFENSKFKKFRPKVTEIRRNLPKFRNEISFPLNTGICNENEMVNPGSAWGTNPKLWNLNWINSWDGC